MVLASLVNMDSLYEYSLMNSGFHTDLCYRHIKTKDVRNNMFCVNESYMPLCNLLLP